MDRTTYNLLAPDVRTAARTTAREWADVIDRDDAEQEIWTRLLDARQRFVDELVSLDKPARVSVLTEIGHQIGMDYRDAYELFSGNYVYGTRQVRKMLENDALAGVDEESGVPIWELPETAIKALERTESRTVTERIDLFIGMSRLLKRNARYVELLKLKYLDGVEFDHEGPDRKACDRAVDALAREMNRVHIARKAEYEEGPGTRKVITNAEAQKLTRNDYSNVGGGYDLIRKF